mmetsp:Transcript_31170/g.98973  ORF Transcript_31170/g.98973 Transcript_31170/m.98973 type:complete len:681 (-) Transcript_31170:847-2889(-)
MSVVEVEERIGAAEGSNSNSNSDTNNDRNSQNSGVQLVPRFAVARTAALDDELVAARARGPGARREPFMVEGALLEVHEAPALYLDAPLLGDDAEAGVSEYHHDQRDGDGGNKDAGGEPEERVGLIHDGDNETMPLRLRSSSLDHQPPGSPAVVDRQKLGVAGLACLIFFSVSGGPFGFEEAIGAGGAGWVLAGCIIMPIIWSVPEALMTAELSSAYPEAAGFGAWVNEAFGPFWAFLCGTLSWVSGVTDNAVYPVMLMDYIQQAGDGDSSEGDDDTLDIPLVYQWIFILGFTIIFTGLTWRGLDVTGSTAIFLTVFCLLPFVVYIGVAAPQIKVTNWFEFRSIEDVDWSTLVNVLFWNYNYWDSSSAWSGDVKGPRTFPVAMLYGLVIVVLTYLLPTMAATGTARVEDHNYCDGCFTDLADEVAGGHWLGYWILAAASVSCVGLFIAEMSSDAFQLMGLADRGILPARLADRSRYGTPTIATLLSAVGVVALSKMSFTEIIELENAMYVVAEVIEFAAFVYLRRHRPDVERPFKIPIGDTWGATLLFLPASFFLVIVLVICSTLTLVLTLVTTVLTCFLYVFLCLARRRRWMEFRPIERSWAASRDPWFIRTMLRWVGADYPGDRLIKGNGGATTFMGIGSLDGRDPTADADVTVSVLHARSSQFDEVKSADREQTHTA